MQAASQQHRWQGADQLVVVSGGRTEAYVSPTQTGSIYSELTSSGVVSGTVPSAINGITALRDGRLLRGVSAGLAATAISREGVVHPVFEGDPHSPGEISGDRSIGIVGTDSQLVDRVWEIAPDNTVRIIADGLTFSHVSAVGDVVHVVGFRPTTNGRGDQVLIRSRPSVAPVEIVISPDIDIAATPLAIITTVEGGAIVGSLFETVIAREAEALVTDLGDPERQRRC